MNLIVALMFGTLISYATEKSTLANSAGKKIIKVEFKNVKKGQTLTIKNANGLTVYNTEIQTSGDYSKNFDLSALDNGFYRAELNKDFEILVRNFKVENGLVTYFNKDSETVFKPVVRTEGDLLYISKIAFNHKPLNVVIYYKNEIILSETLKGEDILKRVYKLSENQMGDYTIVINSDERMYVKNFTI